MQHAGDLNKTQNQLFEAKHIKKTFVSANGEALTALDGFSMSLQKGHFTILFGPSGCGKSTFLRLLAKLDTDYEGKINWGEAPRIGFIFQSPNLLPWRTVKDNILLSRGEGFTDKDFKTLCENLGLKELLNSYPSELSLGLARRVAIARAFAFQPNLLLLDEPFVSLDAPTAERMQGMVADLWKREKMTSLMVTHDMREAIRLGQEILLMSARPGKIIDRVVITDQDKASEEAIEAKRAEIKAKFPHLFEVG